MKFEEVHYGKSASGHNVVHVMEDQEHPFANSIIDRSLCGLPVSEFPRRYFGAAKLCKRCFAMALDLKLNVQYRLPLDVGEG
jgi:hypothetical protein